MNDFAVRKTPISTTAIWGQRHAHFHGTRTHSQFQIHTEIHHHLPILQSSLKQGKQKKKTARFVQEIPTQ